MTLTKLGTQLFDWLFPSRYDSSLFDNLQPSEFLARTKRAVVDKDFGIISICAYKDPLVRAALWSLKYDGNRNVAALFGCLLTDTLIETLYEEALFFNAINPLLIPLPLSRERFEERGWNQSELIAQEIIKRCPHIELQTQLLKKIRHTTPQTKLSRKERLSNLKNCFSVNEKARQALLGRLIILIDDVTTTGSTIEEARQTLLKAGAKKVIAFTVAH